VLFAFDRGQRFRILAGLWVQVHRIIFGRKLQCGLGFDGEVQFGTALSGKDASGGGTAAAASALVDRFRTDVRCVLL